MVSSARPPAAVLRPLLASAAAPPPETSPRSRVGTTAPLYRLRRRRMAGGARPRLQPIASAFSSPSLRPSAGADAARNGRAPRGGRHARRGPRLRPARASLLWVRRGGGRPRRQREGRLKIEEVCAMLTPQTLAPSPHLIRPPRAAAARGRRCSGRSWARRRAGGVALPRVGRMLPGGKGRQRAAAKMRTQKTTCEGSPLAPFPSFSRRFLASRENAGCGGCG